MMLKAKLKHLFTQTRFPYVIMAIASLGATLWECGNINHENQQANRTLDYWKVENIAKIHHNQQEILKYHIQLDAISDEKNAYLNRLTMSSILKNAIAHGNAKKVALPKLSNSPEYTHLDERSIRISNHANNRIAELHADNHADRKAVRYDHHHDWATNAWHPLKAPVFQQMAENGGGACLLLIMTLYFLTKIAKFKDNQRKKWKHEQEDALHAKIEKARKHYISVFGDDRGFDPYDVISKEKDSSND